MIEEVEHADLKVRPASTGNGTDYYDVITQQHKVGYRQTLKIGRSYQNAYSRRVSKVSTHAMTLAVA